MTKGMKAYLVAAGLTLGLHAFGGMLGWFKGVDPIKNMNVRGGGWSGGGFRGGK